MTPSEPSRAVRGVWSTSEHERFLEAIALYPQGPWPLITAHVGTRSAKQVQTHAQKYQHKLKRHQRGLRKCKTKSKRPEHRVDPFTADQLMNTKCWIPRPLHRQSGAATPGASASEYSWEASDCSYHSELDYMLRSIEPVPFLATNSTPSTSDSARGVDLSEDPLILDAFAAILSWSPPADTNILFT